MKANKKALALVLCALMLVAASVFGTLAYLTDTDTVVNTFTVGHVDIILNEANVNEKGQPIKQTTVDGVTTTTVIDYSTDLKNLLNADRVTGNEYHLVPGHTYTKDPTVTVKKGSEESYVRMLVTVGNFSKLTSAIPKDKYPEYYAADGVFLLQKLCNWDPETSKWKYEKCDSTTGTYEFRYKDTVGTWGGSAADEVLEALFTEITLPGEIFNNAQMDIIDGVSITSVAHAIQADGFTDAATAWTNFDDSVAEYSIPTT